MSNWTFGSHHYLNPTELALILYKKPRHRQNVMSHRSFSLFSQFSLLWLFQTTTFHPFHAKSSIYIHPPLLIFIHSHPLSTILSNIIYFHPYPYHPTSSIFIKCQQFSSILFNVIHFHDFSSISSIILSATMSVTSLATFSTSMSTSPITTSSP